MNAAGHYEPELTVQVLPRCPACEAPHPRAQGLDSATCPGCGGPAAEPGTPTTHRAEVIGPIARFLRGWSK